MRVRQAFLFGAFLFLSPVVMQASAQNQQPPTKWEYQVLDDCPEPPKPNWVGVIITPHPTSKYVDLQKLGDEGWELVNTENTVSKDGAYDCRRYFFKRLKTSAPPPPRQAMPTDPVYPKCLLRSDKAPMIQGLRLGLNKDGLQNLFKRPILTSQTNATDPNAMPAEVEIGRLELSDASNNPYIGASVTLFEDTVIRYEVVYEFDHKWQWSMKEWKNKLADSFGLPLTAWEEITSDDQTSQLATCRDFSVETRFTGVNYHLSLRVTSLTGMAKLKKAKESYWQQRRTVFKP